MRDNALFVLCYINFKVKITVWRSLPQQDDQVCITWQLLHALSTFCPDVVDLLPEGKIHDQAGGFRTTNWALLPIIFQTIKSWVWDECLNVSISCIFLHTSTQMTLLLASKVLSNKEILTSVRGFCSGWAVSPATCRICLAVGGMLLSSHCKLKRKRRIEAVRQEHSVVDNYNRKPAYMVRTDVVGQCGVGFVWQPPGCFQAWPSEKPPDS